MLRLMMGFQMLIAFAFFIGIGAEEDEMMQCLNMVEFDKEFESIINQASKEQLNTFCTGMTGLLRCVNDLIKEETGFSDLREFVDFLEGTDFSKGLEALVNIEDLVINICAEGTTLHQDYLANAQCFRNVDENVPEQCEQQANDAYETFRNLQDEAGDTSEENSEECLTVAYQLGCMATAIHEDCGDGGFKTYKEIVKKVGFFKSGICSSEIMQSVKTSFIDNLNMSETRKSLYRVIFDMKKRRK